MEKRGSSINFETHIIEVFWEEVNRLPEENEIVEGQIIE